MRNSVPVYVCMSCVSLKEDLKKKEKTEQKTRVEKQNRRDKWCQHIFGYTIRLKKKLPIQLRAQIFLYNSSSQV